jgi:hypothetical protein
MAVKGRLVLAEPQFDLSTIEHRRAVSNCRFINPAMRASLSSMMHGTLYRQIKKGSTHEEWSLMIGPES